MINLAPKHKMGLLFRNPVMIAAGCYGWGAQYRDRIDPEPLGAVVVGPVTARPRRGSERPRLMQFPGGLLVGTGLANPGISRVVRENRRHWSRSPAPVIVHVAGTSPSSVGRCCSTVAALEEVAAIELGLLESASGEHVADLVSAALDAAGHPLIVRVPLGLGVDAARRIEDLGVDALAIAGPPLGYLYHDSARAFVGGWLYGPFVLPLVLESIMSVADAVSLPLIGVGGVWNEESARTLLQAGCLAVQIDAAVWRDPGCAARIASALAD